MGLWFFFTSVGMFALMLDAGFSATLTRNFRYIISNSRIYKKGIDHSIGNSVKLSIEEMYFVAKRIYLYLSLFSIIVLALTTIFIFNLIQKNNLSMSEHFIAWIVYSVSIVLNLRFYYGGAVLNGLNQIASSQKIDIITLLINYSIASILIMLNIGLLSLSIGIIISLLFRIYLYKINILIGSNRITRKKFGLIFNILWPNTWKTGISNLLGYFIRYLSTYFIAFFLGLKISGSYGLTFQIILLIYAISNVWINTCYPILSSYRAENSRIKFYELFYINFKRSIITFLLLSMLFLLFGDFFLTLLGSNTPLLPFELTLFLIFHMFVDFVTNIYGYIIMTGNKVPFIKSSIITVVLIVILNIIFNQLNFGLWGVLIANFSAGLIYNYWYWIYNGYVDLAVFYKDSWK
jgi:O-antigen/teichoic acid export membrane protein